MQTKHEDKMLPTPGVKSRRQERVFVPRMPASS